MKKIILILVLAFIASAQISPLPPRYEYGLSVSRGQVPYTSFINKFGENPDIDAADGFLTIWEQKSLYTYSDTFSVDVVNPLDSLDTLSVLTSNISLISSSDSTDTTTIEVQCLDANYDLLTQTASINGHTPDTLATPCLRVFRMINTGNTSLTGDVYLYVDTSTVADGVPTLASNIRAQITDGNNQTLMAIYTIPRGYTGYAVNYHIALSKTTAATASSVRFFVRPRGQVFQLKETTALSSVGNSIDNKDYSLPVVIPEMADIEVRANASANNTGVSASFSIILIKN